MRDKFHLTYGLAFAALFCLGSFSLAVSSKISRHSSGVDLAKGEAKNVVVDSEGNIQLSRAAETMVEQFEEDVWSINSIVVSGGTVYLGTSPNGGIYKYSLGKLTKIYPTETQDSRLKTPDSRLQTPDSRLTTPDQQNREPNDANELLTGDSKNAATLVGDANTVKAEQYLSNEHIFAMATDVAGRLLAGISGDKCALCRLEADKMQIIFEPNDANEPPPCGPTKYIFAIAIDDGGNIYLATGPQGKIYQLDSFAEQAQLLYDSRDKNILSLAIGQDGFVYAGSDSRGLVYKINPRTKTATVLYDSDQPEITALLMADSEQQITDSKKQKAKRYTLNAATLYAAATSAKIIKTETEFARQLPLAGRPESDVIPPGQRAADTEGGRRLQIANTKKETDEKPPRKQIPVLKRAKPAKASYIHRISKDGYVTDIFNKPVVFFCLAAQQQKLLVGTGNDAQLFTVDPASEQEAIIYEDEQASQITAVTVCCEDVYLGTANPAKLIKLGDCLAAEGTYTSALIDAGQPAKWGKLQIDADIPKQCNVQVASRSGNVEDVNDPTFSDWTELAEITEPIQLRCPLGRFCQYKLVLKSEDGRKSPLVREIAVAHTIPNLAPKVESVSVSRVKAADKTGTFKISYKAKDDNGDKLIYKIDFRKIGRTNWIELEDKNEADSFEWDGKTVEDGRYEVRITASDEKSNTATTKLTGSRVSDPVVVDNTGPVIKKYSIKEAEKAVTLKLQVSDELSAIGQVHYTVDSNDDWIGVVPDDLVYDTTDEDFTIVIEDLQRGEHITAVRVSDDLGNTTYKTFEVKTE